MSTARPSLSRNALWNASVPAWNMVVTFLLTPYMVVKLGSDHYGLLVLLLTISGVLGFMELGLGEATVRFVAHYHGRRDVEGVNRVIGATYAVHVASALLAWCLLFGGAPWVVRLFGFTPGQEDLGVRLVRVTAFTLAAGLAFAAFTAVPEALQRFDVRNRINFVRANLTAAGTFAILWTGRGVLAVVVWNLVATLAGQGADVVAARRLLPTIRLWPAPTRRGLREVFGYGVFSLLTRILSLVWSQADRLIVGIFMTPAAVGYLAVPQQLAQRVRTLLGSVGGVLLPRFSTLGRGAEARRLFLEATRTMLLVSIVIFVPLTVLLPDFLRLWINEEFARNGGRPGALIVGACVVAGAFFPYQMLLAGFNKPHLQTLQSLASASVGLVVNLVLIPRYGLLGAGYSYVATTGVGLGSILLTWRYLLGERSTTPIVRSVVLPAALGFAVLAVGLFARSRLPAPGWVGLGGMGAALAAATTVVVLGAEVLVHGRASAVIAVLRGVLRPGSRAGGGAA